MRMVERICQTPGATYNSSISDHTVEIAVTLPDAVEVGDMTDEQGDAFDDMLHDAMEKIVAKIIADTQPDAAKLWQQARDTDPD